VNFSPLFIVLLRVATKHLIESSTPASRVTETFIQTKLKPRRWTKPIVEQVVQCLQDEHILAQKTLRYFEVQSLSQDDILRVRKNCMGPMASIDHLYEECVITVDGDDVKRHDLLPSLQAYAANHDYTTAEGCDRMVRHDEFGDEIEFWGYHPRVLNEGRSNRPGNSETPRLRRKISLSRMLLNVGDSPSTMSATSIDEASTHLYDDCSIADSAATAD
jgi:hypothetical protein